jgi:hypothetical protein
MKKGAAAGGTAPKETLSCRQRVKSLPTRIQQWQVNRLRGLRQAALRPYAIQEAVTPSSQFLRRPAFRVGFLKTRRWQEHARHLPAVRTLIRDQAGFSNQLRWRGSENLQAGCVKRRGRSCQLFDKTITHADVHHLIKPMPSILLAPCGVNQGPEAIFWTTEAYDFLIDRSRASTRAASLRRAPFERERPSALVRQLGRSARPVT